MPLPILCQTVGFVDSIGTAVNGRERVTIPFFDGTVSWYYMLPSDKMYVAGLIASHLMYLRKDQVPHRAFVQGYLRILPRIKDLPSWWYSPFRLLNVVTRTRLV
jgi:hypothetical protein